jgi:uncharacterized repeat protein (TIGR03803 family)
MDSSGNLYGTTNGGGASNDGAVFEVAMGHRKITTLVSFNGTDGQGPLGGLVRDSSGNLYGTANSGGASSAGTIFEVTGAAAPAERGPAAAFVTSTSQPMSGAAGPALADRPELSFEPVVVAGWDTGEKKAATVAVEPAKAHARGQDRGAGLQPAGNTIADIDQLFAEEWRW